MTEGIRPWKWRGHYIGGAWEEADGVALRSTSPADGLPVWTGCAADAGTVMRAIGAAASAFPSWKEKAAVGRQGVLEAFADRVRDAKEELAKVISVEVGKPLWEARTEIDAIVGKVRSTLDAYAERAHDVVRAGAGGAESVTRYNPLGVVAVLGPFNFPGHMANGHIMPALLAGNTIVFKPSERAPYFAERMVALWHDAGIPTGVLNLIHGGPDTARALAAHPLVHGIFLTGSHRVGLELLREHGKNPEKLLALEMGGNSPLIVWDWEDLSAAVYVVIQSAFVTSGQRCSCARRLIIPSGSSGEMLLDAVARAVAETTVGPPDSVPEPFMGPVISAEAAASLLATQDRLIAAGATPIVPMRQLEIGPAFVTPGILDVTDSQHPPADEEVFGPLLQVRRVGTFEEALDVANATQFGLAAGLVSADAERYEQFRSTIRAGVLAWNVPLTGASSLAPFGGVGQSGNYRPSGYLAIDYCTVGTAALESEVPKLPATLPPGLRLG